MSEWTPSDDFDSLDASARFGFLKRGYDALVLRDERSDARLSRGEGQRVWIFGVVALFGSVTIALVVVVLWVLVSGRDKTAARNAQHDDTQRQIRMLACTAVQFAPPGNLTTDRLRVQYHCPPFGGHLAP